MKQCKNGKSSQIFCFKLLKEGHLLCEALVQNCSDLSHIFAESGFVSKQNCKDSTSISNVTMSIEVCHAECKNTVFFKNYTGIRCISYSQIVLRCFYDILFECNG